MGHPVAVTRVCLAPTRVGGSTTCPPNAVGGHCTFPNRRLVVNAGKYGARLIRPPRQLCYHRRRVRANAVDAGTHDEDQGPHEV